MIDLLGLIVFGAELGIVVDASFLEKRVKLIANGRSSGTFHTQAGVVKTKPNRINNCQLNYFFVKINEASLGMAGSDIISKWNRELGEDCCVKDEGEPYSSNLKKIEGKMDREYALFTKDRVYRQRSVICQQGGCNASSTGAGRDRNNPAPKGVIQPPKKLREGASLLKDLSWGEDRPKSAGKPKAAVDKIQRDAEERASIEEMGDDREDVDSDDEPLVGKRVKVEAAKKAKSRVEEPEMGVEASEEAKKKREAVLSAAGLAARKRKAREENKGDDDEVVEKTKRGDDGGFKVDGSRV